MALGPCPCGRGLVHHCGLMAARPCLPAATSHCALRWAPCGCGLRSVRALGPVCLQAIWHSGLPWPGPRSSPNLQEVSSGWQVGQSVCRRCPEFCFSPPLSQGGGRVSKVTSKEAGWAHTNPWGPASPPTGAAWRAELAGPVCPGATLCPWTLFPVPFLPHSTPTPSPAPPVTMETRNRTGLRTGRARLRL